MRQTKCIQKKKIEKSTKWNYYLLRIKQTLWCVFSDELSSCLLIAITISFFLSFVLLIILKFHTQMFSKSVGLLFRCRLVCRELSSVLMQLGQAIKSYWTRFVNNANTLWCVWMEYGGSKMPLIFTAAVCCCFCCLF